MRLGPQSYTVVGVLAYYQPTPQFFDVINNSGQDARLLSAFRPDPRPQSRAGARRRQRLFRQFDSNDPDAYFDASEVTWIQYWVELDPARRGDYEHFVDAYVTEQKAGGRFPRPLNNRVTPLMEWMRVRAVVPPATVGLVVIALLFLAVCCLNLTGLLLGKFLSRSGVLGVHRALGAPRSAIFLQRLLECELIGVAGGVSAWRSPQARCG